jgi:2-polyprenyl-6-methoxyphenol hydroxylase-like FAD-dependent oxidoreductase
MQVRPQDYLYWGLVAPRERYAATGQPEPTDANQLRQLAHRVTRDWHPLFARLIDMTPSDGMQLLVFRSSVPHGPWQSGRVTLLGDAVHAMVPMRGEGANTALHDAGLLTQFMQGVLQGQPLTAAISGYEAQMLKYGFGKVKESLSSLEMFVSGPRLRRRAMHGVLQTVQRGKRLFRGGVDAPPPAR